MSDVLINRVKLNLKSKCYLANDTWLKECIEYYISENNDASLNSVEAFVTSQWILSDLREISNEKPSLPPNFSSKDKSILPGKYILQVDKMCDISQSKYSQLQKIRNVSEVNVKATAIETPAWEPKGKRMIQMHLTDGMQDFTAIEYKPIKTLKETLLPGFKLMIIGPVMCRKGVMMLKEENYKEIGGEVDSLLKINALENVLARALGMEENENPYADDNQGNNAAVQNDNEFPEDEFDVNFDEITQIERLSMESREPTVNNRPGNQDLNPRNKLLDNTNSRNNKELSSQRQNSNNKTTINDFYKPQREMGNNYHRNSQEVEKIDDFVDPFSLSTETNINIVSRGELKPMISKPSSFKTQNINSNEFNNRGVREVKQIATTSSTVISVDDCFDDIDFGEELDEDMFRVTEKKVLAKPKPEIIKKSQSPIMTRDASPERRTTTLSGSKRPADILSPLGCSAKIMCLQTTPQLNKKNRKITEFTEKVVPKEEMPPKICEFICDIIREPASETHSFKTVRGKVTRIGNLIKKDKNWILQATITDDTASLEIMFASQVLEELIGFTVQEFSEKKKLRKKNPEIEEYLREGFRKAEFQVQRMDALMELEISPGDSLPKVVNTKELSEEDKELIDKRMKMMAAG